ncbi:MAG TPA: cytochrome c peroxidase [Polyangiaceae bacterium]|nr:cytochrome c peroxidase [Polyangiaceae bacterium]
MSGLLSKRTWLGGVALLAAMGAAACGDDDDSTAPTGGTSSGGNAGSNHGGDGGSSAGTMSQAGKTNGGSAGKGGTNGGSGGSQSPLGGQGGDGEQGGVGGSGGELGGAGGEGGQPISEIEQLRKAFSGMSPLPAVPADATNKYADSAAAAALGQKLFFDKKFSGALKADNDLGTMGQTGKVSCASCHSGPAMIDERNNHEGVATATGINTRNAPAVVNSAFYTWTNWGARFSAQWELPLVVVENANLMAFNRLALAHRIFDAYKDDYNAAFDDDLAPEIGTDAGRFPAIGKPGDAAFDNMAGADKTIVNRILANYSKALQAYMRKLVSREAPFDTFMAGDDNALTAAEIRGAWQFVERGCGSCHSGPHFSDQDFHNLGVPQTGLNVPATDDGRFANTPALVAGTNLFNRNGDFSDDKNTGKLETIPAVLPDTWKGVFRTPTLRGVALTAPYMHTGQLATLSDVIDFYAAGGGGNKLPTFTITAQEKADLVAFLGTLTGKAVPNALLTDTSAP